jgi:hypothetical protein
MNSSVKFFVPRVSEPLDEADDELALLDPPAALDDELELELELELEPQAASSAAIRSAKATVASLRGDLSPRPRVLPGATDMR